MPLPKITTIGDLLFWSYANLAMAHKATRDGDSNYGQIHFIIRQRLFSGLKKKKFQIGSLVKSQKVRMKLPQECIYCASVEHLALDHIIPLNRGGYDGSDNVIWSCRSCNSAKKDLDLFAWFERKGGFPPLFLIQLYLKQAIEFCEAHNLLEIPIDQAPPTPFAFDKIPTNYPDPPQLVFTFHHKRKKEAARNKLERETPGNQE